MWVPLCPEDPKPQQSLLHKKQDGCGDGVGPEPEPAQLSLRGRDPPRRGATRSPTRSASFTCFPHAAQSRALAPGLFHSGLSGLSLGCTLKGRGPEAPPRPAQPEGQLPSLPGTRPPRKGPHLPLRPQSWWLLAVIPCQRHCGARRAHVPQKPTNPRVCTALDFFRRHVTV